MQDQISYTSLSQGVQNKVMEDEYEILDATCPRCGNDHVHTRDCSNIFCEFGLVEDDDDPGMTRRHKCEECKGTEFETWCPKCGANLSGVKLQWHEQEDF